MRTFDRIIFLLIIDLFYLFMFFMFLKGERGGGVEDQAFECTLINNLMIFLLV